MNPQDRKTPMAEQEPVVRARNFEEVAKGYSAEEAQNEAERCLGCKHRPCVAGCPVGVPIPEFIGALSRGDFEDAYNIIYAQNALPAVCGRVCPQEKQCEALCVRGKKGEPVAIGRLERFAADTHIAAEATAPSSRNGGSPTPAETPLPPQTQTPKIPAAVIGSGPAGLSCAGELARNGVPVTIFEAFHEPGGVLGYGIPEFRLPGDIVKREIDALRAMGVRMELNTVAGRTVTVDELFAEGYGAVFLGVGAGLPVFMNIPGEHLIGVFSANEYLTRINLMKAYHPEADTPIYRGNHVVVVGGGNVAMDAARCALRMGAESVTIAYRRTKEDLPARQEEIHHAEEEGVLFRFLSAPLELLGDEQGRVRQMRLGSMTGGEPDASGRRRPVLIPDKDFLLPADMVISAIGTSPNPLLAATTKGLETDRRGCIRTDPDSGETSRPAVFAGGDIATGAATVILAMGAGKRAAASMLRYLMSIDN